MHKKLITALILSSIPLIALASVLGIQQGGTALQYPLTGFQSGTCLTGNGLGAIGTTTCGGSSGGGSMWATSTDTTSIYPNSATKVGIGTTSPVASLDSRVQYSNQLWGGGYWSQSGLVSFDATKVNNGNTGDYAFHTDSSGAGSYLKLDTGRKPASGPGVKKYKYPEWLFARRSRRPRPDTLYSYFACC